MNLALSPRVPVRSRVACAVLAPLAAIAAACNERVAVADDVVVSHLASPDAEVSVESGSAPAAARRELSWSFAEPQPEWQTMSSEVFERLSAMERSRGADCEHLRLTGPGFPVGGLRIELEDQRLDDWDSVIVRARSHDRFAGITAVCNLDEASGLPSVQTFFQSTDEAPPIFNDGSVQRYAIPLRASGDAGELHSVSILVATPTGPATLDVLDIELVPRGASYLEDHGTRNVPRAGVTYHTLYAHTPARLDFPVRRAAATQLDFALTVNPGEAVTYRVLAIAGDEREPLFEETIEDATRWHPRSVSWSADGVAAMHVVLEASSDRKGAVALWGAPILSAPSAPAAPERPNVVFYVIDGGDNDFMSLYGYERETTPFLEQLAAEGVLFTRAHSNSTWTQPSTVSFMTSLHHSVLGGLRRGMHSTSVPAAAVTMAEHFRRAGYSTASFTANPNAGRIIGTDRGVDVMRDTATEHHSTSSVDLHRYFREFRDQYPGQPYWVHFQTTDVHEPNHPEPPFAHRYTTKERTDQLEAWENRVWQVAWRDFGTTSVSGFWDLALEKAEIDRQAFFTTRRDLYAETMAHQDHTLEELVGHLKETGEWENTIFVVGSDHGHPAGTFARFGRALLDPRPEAWEGALCDAYATGVPLLFVWPGHIEGGRRIDDPVSMIDVLPTLLELADLPHPRVVQGQSLAPLLRGEPQELAPVILDEFRVDEATGEMIGNLEIVDGRWGASLEIGPVPEGADPSRGRRVVPAGGRWGAVHPFFPDVPRLLLFDLEDDPYATRDVGDEHPELVKKYTALLREQWRAHRALALEFSDTDDVVMTPEQLEQLRALGYIR